MEKFLQQTKDFFTVRNCLIVIIGLLMIIIIFQNLGRRRGPVNFSGGRQNITNGYTKKSSSTIGIPGMGGGGFRDRNMGQ